MTEPRPTEAKIPPRRPVVPDLATAALREAFRVAVLGCRRVTKGPRLRVMK